MGPIDQVPSLPIEVDQAVKIYPDLASAANDLERILQSYIDADRIFRQKFLNLFPRRII